MAIPGFGISVKPISTREADYAQYISSYPPGFLYPSTVMGKNCTVQERNNIKDTILGVELIKSIACGP